MLSEPPPTRYDWRWRAFGIPVRVHPGFWLLSALLGYYPGIGLLELAAWCVAVLLSILVHEAGHAVVARRHRARNVRITLSATGGLTSFLGARAPRAQALSILAGPGAGFCLAAAAGTLLAVGHHIGTPALLLQAAADLVLINLVWGALNLVPVLPLDGGQLLLLALTTRHGVYVGLPRARRVSMWIAGGLAGAGLLWSVAALVLGGPRLWWLSIVFAILAWWNWQLSRPRFIDAELAAEDEERRVPWQQDPDWWK